MSAGTGGASMAGTDARAPLDRLPSRAVRTRRPLARAGRCAALALAAAAAAGTVLAAAGAEGLPGKWVEVRSPHFVVVGNDGRRSASNVAVHFEQIRELFARAIPGSVVESGPPLRVFAVSDERTLKRLLPEYWEERGRAKPVGVFRATPTGYDVAVRADLLGSEHYEIVYHEYFHFLIHRAGWELPLWVDEGLASFWGNTRLAAKAAEVGRPAVELVTYLRNGRFMPLAEMMAVDHSSPAYKRRVKKEQFYAQTWALVHYLNLGDQTGRRRRQFDDYLRRIAAGEPSEQAAPAAFGDLGAVESELRAYTRKLLMPYVTMALPAPLPPDRLQVRDLSPGEAAALAAIFQLDGLRTDGVDELVAFALAGAPDTLATQVAVGVLRALQGEYDTAAHAFERATQLEGVTPLAHYGVAVLTLYREPTPASLKIAEAHLARALVLDPRFAPAKARLAEVYRRTDGCSQRGLMHIRGARMLVPEHALYELKEAQLLLACGQVEEARAIARRVAAEAAGSESTSEHNEICWLGSLWGLAGEVLPACERGVALAPESAAIRDSRGVARAIASDLPGATADLRAALELAGEGGLTADVTVQRAAWILVLEDGGNPLAGDGLATFRADPQAEGLGWWL